MANRPDILIKSILGEDFFEELKKSDVYKINTKTVTSTDEIATGLKIVPRAVMSFLISSLSHLEPGDNKELELPFAPGCHIQLSKKDHDSFSGFIYSEGKKINEFTHRSIPGIGLVLMTTFELYDVDNLKDNKQKEEESFNISRLQSLIDERLMLHSLISRVVDHKIAQRDAIEALIKEKLKQAISIEKEKEVWQEKSKTQKLKDFLEQKQKRQEEAQIEKTEQITCPDCGTPLYDGGKKLTLCICYGSDWNKDIKIIKNENIIKMRFPKNMEADNIQMLLGTLKNINSRK